MKTLTIQQKVYGAIAVLSVLVVIAGAVIDHYSTKIAEDSVVLDVLGRQRMLTQAMGKAALLNASQNEYETAKNMFTQKMWLVLTRRGPTPGSPPAGSFCCDQYDQRMALRKRDGKCYELCTSGHF